jgi:hypothetical protein
LQQSAFLLIFQENILNLIYLNHYVLIPLERTFLFNINAIATEIDDLIAAVNLKESTKNYNPFQMSGIAGNSTVSAYSITIAIEPSIANKL